MLKTYTAHYAKIPSGYMGQIVEWTEIITEGKDIEDCRYMLRDALNEMILDYVEMGKELPEPGGLIEQLAVDTEHASQAA